MAYEYEFIRHFKGTHLKTFLVNISHRLYHWHSDIELLLILEGSVIINTAHEQYELKKDDLFLINRNEVHSLMRTKETNTILTIQFDPMFCSSYYPGLQRVRFTDKHIKMSEDPDTWAIIRKYLMNILMEYFKKESGYPLKLMSSLNMLTFFLLKYMNYEIKEESTILEEGKKLTRLSRIISYIQENFMNKISLKDLAANEDLDLYYLSHFIKKQLGISFQEYVNKIRLEKATDLIIHTNKSYLDICIECGFSDYRYLCKWFIKEYGCKPSLYKQEYKNLQLMIPDPESGVQHQLIDEKNALEKLIRYLGA